jgi:rubrerythrin
MNPEEEPLALAFVHQSIAAAKNRVRAQKAAQEAAQKGEPAGGCSAGLFLALAQAQEVHAKKALMLLRGRIGTSLENRDEAVQEAREMAVETLGWTVLAQAEGDHAAGALLVQMARSLASHLSLPAVDARTGAAPEAEQGYWVCCICGHIHAGSAPGRCPVCQAVPDKFSQVPA